MVNVQFAQSNHFSDKFPIPDIFTNDLSLISKFNCTHLTSNLASPTNPRLSLFCFIKQCVHYNWFIIIILIMLLFPGDMALWFINSLLSQLRRRKNSCMGCFAIVCGKEQQNVIKRKQALEKKRCNRKNTNYNFFAEVY